MAGSVGKKKTENVDVLIYRYRAFPNEEQRILFAKTFGCTRYLWNRMLSDHNELYRVIGKVPNNTPADYKDLDECKWLCEVDSLALANVQLNLDSVFTRFFNGLAGYPKFKKKGKNDSYTTNVSNKTNPNISLELDPVRKDTAWLKLPKLKSRVEIRLHRKIKEGGILKKVCIKKEPDGHYYCSLTFEYPKMTVQKVQRPQKDIGLDMKLNGLYMDNEGHCADIPSFYRQMEKKIARQQRILSHMKKDSQNYKKQKQKIAKLHAKTKRQRKDLLDKLSAFLTDTYDRICIEDLDMHAMAQALSLGKSVSDNGWGMFARMLQYKAERKGKWLIKVDRFFPSSKICSVCGHVHKELQLSDRIYICPECGNVMDRDHQAACNILREGIRIWEDAIAMQ